MIRSGLRSTRTLNSTRIVLAGTKRVATRVYLSTSRTGSHPKSYASRVFAAGVILAGGVAATYALSSTQLLYNDDPNAAAIEITGPTGTASLKALNDDGKLRTYVWGSNKYKLIAPESDKDNIRVPQAVSSWTGAALRDLAFHEKHAACVDAAGDVYQWGSAYSGEGNPAKGPQRTLSGKHISKVVLTAARVFALSEKTGKIYVLAQDAEKQNPNDSSRSSWWNLAGWLGGGSSVDHLELRTDSKLGRGEKFTSICAGRDHLIALTSHGRTFSLPISLSANTYGQLGFRKFTVPDTTAENPATAPRIPIELTPRVLEDPHALATPFIRTRQTGASTHVQPGIGFCDMLFEVPSLRGINVVQALAGDRCSYVRTQEGRVLAWGANSFGQLGLGATSVNEAVTIPTEVVLSRNYPGGTSELIAFAMIGGDLAYFVVETISSDNASSVDVLACGMGQWGSLGNGLYAQAQGAPVKVKTVSGVTEYNEATQSIQPLRTRAISVSPSPQTPHTLLTLDTGALGEAPREHNAHPVGHDVLVLGYNADGQLGNGKRSSLCIPSHIPALGGVIGRMMLRERKKVPLVDLGGNKCGSGQVEETAVAGWDCSAVYWRIV